MKKIKMLCDPMLCLMYLILYTIFTINVVVSVSLASLIENKQDSVIISIMAISSYVILVITAMSFREWF